MSTCRFATFNVALNREKPGELKQELKHKNSKQLKNVAEVLQRVRPDVVLLNEFDHDGEGEDLDLLTRFQANYLALSQNGAESIQYPYVYMAPTNTGLLSSVSFLGKGVPKLPSDGYGFGDFHGQYGFVILSQFPLMIDECRTFQYYLWKDMPNAQLPIRANGQPFYNKQALQQFRLSSKNHIDLPVEVEINNTVHRIHLLAMHPTPPIFEGEEKRNSRRNHDEIRLFADYISGKKGDYLVDDRGVCGGLASSERFVLLGDFNADPNDGDSYNSAINQLLLHSDVNQQTATGEWVPKSTGAREYSEQNGYQCSGDTSEHTHLFPLRLDYLLPSRHLSVVNSGVYWPAAAEKQHYLLKDSRRHQATSDHRLVWVDISL
ncbi:MAG: endonuclease/exonuclease/phosphatase family protein [Aliivibrio sp.]|uniref:endonuclease/exonuclease/phosphatase family protein n=1 Tax=Aliivibrio sp. TaxID=1872443 RepID=UPI001A3D253B|nr:endonuclease/exonuclease/phosphatase family protein [Aliivibrio sp.]